MRSSSDDRSAEAEAAADFRQVDQAASHAPPNAAEHGAPVEAIPLATGPGARTEKAEPKPTPRQADGATPPVMEDGKPHGLVHRFRPVHEQVGEHPETKDPIWKDYVVEEWVPEEQVAKEKAEAAKVG